MKTEVIGIGFARGTNQQRSDELVEEAQEAAKKLSADIDFFDEV